LTVVIARECNHDRGNLIVDETMIYNMYNKNNNSGFTLVEILVAMAIFVTSITAMTTIFSYSNKSQRVTETISEVQSDARFAMEVMAQQIRRGSIDYSSSEYGGTISSNPQDVLVLLDADDNQVWFRRYISEGHGVAQLSYDGITWVDLTPPDVNVDLLKFYLSPSTDPFGANPSVNIQPKVTIVMATKSNQAAGENIPSTFLQTTISSRKYAR